MDKFITYKEQELKDNIEWIKTYTTNIILICEEKNLHSIKQSAKAILKQLEDFKLST